MEQKTSWINYLIIGISLVTGLSLSSCGIAEYEWTADLNIHFINETNDTIYTNLHDNSSHLDCSFSEILPNETEGYSTKQEFYGNHKSDKPTIESVGSRENPINIECDLFYGKTHNCERGTDDISNYENIKEIGPLDFELTFRFTEEKKAKAEANPCN